MFIQRHNFDRYVSLPQNHSKPTSVATTDDSCKAAVSSDCWDGFFRWSIYWATILMHKHGKDWYLQMAPTLHLDHVARLLRNSQVQKSHVRKAEWATAQLQNRTNAVSTMLLRFRSSLDGFLCCGIDMFLSCLKRLKSCQRILCTCVHLRVRQAKWNRWNNWNTNCDFLGMFQCSPMPPKGYVLITSPGMYTFQVEAADCHRQGFSFSPSPYFHWSLLTKNCIYIHWHA